MLIILLTKANTISSFKEGECKVTKFFLELKQKKIYLKVSVESEMINFS